MSPPRRPAASIGANEFFSSWLPREIRRLGRAAGLPDVLFRVTLDGEGGGSWDLLLCGSELLVSTRHPALTPLFTIRLSVEDWRSAIEEQESHPSLLPLSVSPADLLLLDEAAHRSLRGIRGSYAFEIHNLSGRTWCMRVTLGEDQPDGQPTGIITTDADTYWAIREHRISAPDAFFSGKIAIRGDAGGGMQVGLTLLGSL